MMQLKGAKSDNTERYKKALGMSKDTKFGMMPSEKARLAEEKAERERKPDAPIIKTEGELAAKARSAEEAQQEDDSHDSDLDDLMGADDDDFMATLRAKRIAELKAQQSITQNFRQAGQGSYNEIKEDEFLPTLNGSKFCIVHFYHKDFESCKVVDMHLDRIAKKHLETKIVRLNAEKAHFFVAKLGVRTLPTVINFVEGISKKRLIGLEDMGGLEFPTKRLERWFLKEGMIKKTEEDEEDDDEEEEARREALLNPIKVAAALEFDEINFSS
jgi:hypothetical protein